MNLPPNRSCTNVRETDHTVMRITVQLCRCDLLLFEPFNQRIKDRMFKTKWFINIIFFTYLSSTIPVTDSMINPRII
ncbi:hypothetical protein ABIE02_003671 [Leclercia sp. 1548]